MLNNRVASEWLSCAMLQCSVCVGYRVVVVCVCGGGGGGG